MYSIVSKFKLQKYVFVLFVIFFLTLLSGCLFFEELVVQKPVADGLLTVHYIDVGQGEATLLAGSDFTILIDAGRHDQDDLLPYLESVGVQEIDLLIGTHPHADHIGQMSKVIEKIEVTEVWLSGDVHTSKTFERTIDTILAADISYHEPRAGEVYELGSLLLEVLNPVELTGDFHEGCLALRAVYGDVAFIFTGDIEKQTERAMIERGEPLAAQIIQLAHHGSSTSNSVEFLRAVNPEFAIYSAEKGNSYGHPHKEVLQSLKQENIPVYGTEDYGTILVQTDGKTYELQLN